MGNRANFVLVDSDGWQLNYAHWAGCRMLDALVAGPDLAVRYIRTLEQSDKRQWVNELWADGGAVVDLHTRMLTFFGDELMGRVQERRAVMAVLALTWPGYRVDWAYDGVNELAAHVDVDRSLVRWRTDDSTMPPIECEADSTPTCQLVSVAAADGALNAWPLRPSDSAAWRGPNLLNELAAPSPQPLALGAIPISGVHVDVRRRTVGVWLTRVEPGLLTAFPKRWPGWRTECWGDRYEEQLLRCDGAVTVPQLDVAAGVDEVESWLRQRIFQTFEETPAGKVLELAQLLAPMAPGLVVSSCAVEHPTTQPTADEWAAVQRAIAELRMREGPIDIL